MSGRAVVASMVCLGLAACGTDKISMSSEVGGGSSSRVLASGAGNSGGSGGTGSEGTSGLGVTGGGGVLDNVIGTDPVGGYVDDIFGPGNPISTILGSGSGPGLIPSAAGALAGDPDAEVVGLGILGTGGLVADLTGTDMLGGALDTGGVVGASIAGGNDGLLGALLNSQAANPPLAPIMGPLASALPTEVLGSALAGLPALGATGEGGLVADLIGTDPVGNLVGNNTPAGGGNDGLLGNIVPSGEAPLAPVGNLLTGTLNVIAGNEPSPLAPLGEQLSALPVLDNILGNGAGSLGGALAPVTGTLGNVPVVGGVLGGGQQTGGTQAPAPQTPAAPAGPLAPVTGLVGGLPVVGGLLGGLGAR